MKNKPAIYLLICALFFAQPASADEFGDMFGLMFRMMLSMMDAMSDVMGDNSNDSGWGGANSVGLGMTAMPVMGMSPWSGMGGMPMNNMGMSPWNSPMMGNPWGQPFSGGYNPSRSPGYNNNYYGNPGNRYPAQQDVVPPPGQNAYATLLNGRWFGDAGEILEVKGNQFRLKNKQSAINGTVRVENNVVSLFVPQTGGVTQYTFARNQSELILQDATGQVLVFRQRPVNRAIRTF